MARGVFGILLLALGILISAFWSYPMWNEISEIKLKKDDRQATLDRVDALARKRDEIAAQYNAISEEDRGKLEEFFPRSPESGLLAMNLDTITSSNGMLLKKIDVDETKLMTEAPRGRGTEEAQEKFSSFPFQILASGNYNSFLSFISSLEKSRRLIDIDKLTFDSGSVIDGKAVRSDFYEFSINAHTYWKK